MAPNEVSCARCDKTKGESEMRRCCKGTYYCNRACERANFRNHRDACARQRPASSKKAATPDSMDTGTASSSTGSSSRNASSSGGALKKTVSNPFTLLDKGKYLHGRPEEDVYTLLVDAHRLRMDDTAKFDGIKEADSLYGGASDGLRGFQGFLAKAKARKGLLPPWWKAEKQTECEALGNGAGWSSLRNKIVKDDVNRHYGDPKFAMQLRMLAEEVYGSGIGGQRGTHMMRMMASMESGSGPRHSTFIGL
ncbi:hypothetical protein F5B20DRAFT_60504 [Whalleya microplaca]|nr:hypothetical protein F5B20DRAFT_60504 [Whalleya microplaca]